MRAGRVSAARRPPLGDALRCFRESCQPFWVIKMVCGYSGRFISFWVGLLGQGRDFLGYNCPVVDADIVNQAGPVSSGPHSFAGSDVEAIN